MIGLLILVSFIMSWAIARFVRRRAISIYQKEHRLPQAGVRILPEGAGLAIVFTWFVTCGCLTAFTDIVPFKLFLAMVPGLFLVGSVILSELKHLPPVFRLVVTAASVACGLYLLGGVDSFTLGSFKWEGGVASLVMNALAFVALVALVYVFRNYDGVDGKEGNLASVVIAICLISIAVGRKNPMFFLIPCVAGFLVRNWHPARYLLGDASASFLGYVIGVFAVYFQNEELCLRNDNISLVTFFIICFVPVFDVVYTAIRRRLNGANLSVPSKNHLYQRLLYSGFSHTAVIFVQLALCGVMMVLASIDQYYDDFEVSMWLLPAAFFVMAVYACWVEKRYPYVPENN